MASNHGAMILTEMPDLLPRPQTPRNASFRRDFYRRWGRENCIVSGTARRVEYRLFRQTLSIKCIARGDETYFIDRRRVTVSDDTYLLLNEGRTYGSLLDTPTEAYSFSIFFRPGLAQEVAGDLNRSLGEALEDGPESVRVPLEFDESLRAHDTNITPVLRFIQRQVAAGVRDEHWLEEQCQFLAGRLIAAQRKHRSGLPTELANALPGKRAEVIRRLASATDFMHAHAADEITLKDIAAAAHLSRFHFLRLFQLVHGRTPVAALRELRTRRALALMESTTLTAGEIAERVGMSRIALWRSLRRQKGAGARELRRLEVSARSAFLGR
jgi:AraC family transcriptional regulator